jgi:hypothetical protein
MVVVALIMVVSLSGHESFAQRTVSRRHVQCLTVVHYLGQIQQLLQGKTTKVTLLDM